MSGSLDVFSSFVYPMVPHQDCPLKICISPTNQEESGYISALKELTDKKKYLQTICNEFLKKLFQSEYFGLSGGGVVEAVYKVLFYFLAFCLFKVLPFSDSEEK